MKYFKNRFSNQLNIRFLKLSLFIILIILIQIPLFMPFFHKGFFPTHDNVQVVRIFEMTQALQFGSIPPRWSSGLLYGYGYPLFVFYSPFVYYIGALLALIGINFLIATKIVFILCFLFGAMGIFALVYYLFGLWPAFVSTIAYSFVPYRAVDVYVRGDLAEFFAYSFFPLVLLANIHLLKKSKINLWGPLFAISFAILIIGHNVSAFIYTAFLISFNLFMIIFYTQRNIKLGIIVIKYALSGIIISAFYWIPLLYEFNLVGVVKFSQFPFEKYFLDFNQIWQSAWNYGGFIDENPMSLQLGQSLIIFLFLVIILNTLVKTKIRKLIYFLSSIMILSILIETKMTFYIWQNITLLHYLQFPWRFHILNTFCGVILIGSFFYLLQQMSFYKIILGKITFTVIILLTIGVIIKESYIFFKPISYSSEPSVSETTTWNDEYLPKWVISKPKDYPINKIRFIFGQGIINNSEWGYLSKNFNIITQKQSTIQIAQIYYPGWNALIDNQPTPIFYNNQQGLMEITVPQDKHYISFVFTKTWWRIVSEFISICGLSYILYIIFYPIILRIFHLSPLSKR